VESAIEFAGVGERRDRKCDGHIGRQRAQFERDLHEERNQMRDLVFARARKDQDAVRCDPRIVAASGRERPGRFPKRSVDGKVTHDLDPVRPEAGAR
jgi:hypothetical protein